VADFSALLEGCQGPVAFGVGHDGSLLAAARTSDESAVEVKGGATFPKSRLKRPSDYLVVSLCDGDQRRVVVRNESLSVSHVQPVPGGVLLAGARCHWRSGDPEKNAVVCDGEGRPVKRFCLGDGIEDLRVSPDGTIWVSYFDEGVFGNYGWGHHTAPPVGASGLVAFDPDGGVRFTYDAEKAGTDSICDAYATNVCGDDDVWICFYTDFRLVHVVRGTYEVWPTGLAGMRAIAVRDNRVLFFGDYQNKSRARVLELGPRRASSQVDEFDVVDPAGETFDTAWVCGVRDRLFLFRDRQVFTLEDW